MTLNKLAELTGTSVSTVSKAFSGARDVGEETRQRIFRVARENGCFEKYSKGPRERRLIGILCPEVESEYYGTMLGCLEREIRARGADAVMAVARFDPEREAELFSMLALRLKVDGTILIGSKESFRNPEELPVVVIGGGLSGGTDNVRIGVGEAMKEAVRLLKSYGHRDVGFIGEERTDGTRESFLSAMREAGLPVRESSLVTDLNRFGEAGYSAMETLISRGKLPSAVVAAYDYMALGAIRCVRDHGLRVPEDVSFIGVNDISVTPYLDVPLTSIYTDTPGACGRVVDLLFRKIENRHYRDRDGITIRAELHSRASVYDRRTETEKNEPVPVPSSP